MYNVLPLKKVIDEHIKWVLYLTDNNISEAAEMLEMHRRSLQRYLRRSRKSIPKRRVKRVVRRRK